MSDDATYIVACHTLKAACINRGVDCDELCMMSYEDRPCQDWSGNKSIPDLLKEEKTKEFPVGATTDWVCSKCGYTHDSIIGIDKCPNCGKSVTMRK